MGEIITIASNATLAKLHKPSRDVKLQVQSILGYAVAGAEHSMAFKKGSWDGRSSFFEFKLGTFPAGFVHFVSAKLREKGYTVNLVRKPLPAPLGPLKPIVDAFGDDPRYDYQPEVVNRLVKHGQIIAQVATGGGKCLGRDTPVMLFDGTIKPVQEIDAGDWLMGPDSRPRLVLSTCAGVGPLYRVTPVKGDAYVVNDAHILSLKKTSRGYRGKNRDGAKYPKGEIINTNVENYLAESKTFRHIHKGWRTGVDFSDTEALSVDPYLLGVILGDGTINGTVSVTTGDAEIVQMLEDQAKKWGLSITVCAKPENAAATYYLSTGRTGGSVNPLMLELRAIGLTGGDDNKSCRKFIPHHYKTSSRDDRLALLAGILDSDGYYDGKGMYLTLKEERLFDDTLFLARSLGFAAYKKQVQKRCHNNGVVETYYAMVISGYLDIIPVRLPRRKAAPRLQKKDPLVTGLTVETIGEGEYFGFEIDGDHLFLLGDFTVTHNTRIAKMAYVRIGRPTLFLTTRGILMYQMKDSFERDLNMKVSVLGDGQFGHMITEAGLERQAVRKMCVGMVQTLIARLEEQTVAGEIDKMLNALVKRELKELKAYRLSFEKAKHLEPAIRAELAKIEKQQELARPTSARLTKVATTKVERHMKERAQTIQLLGMFELVILEEAHEASGNSYFEILKHCKNAHYRLALTATPFMKDSEESNMRLMACSGPIAIRITEKMLIDRGILARPYFKIIPTLVKPAKLHKHTAWQAAYRLGIVENEHRNNAIADECLRMASYGLTSMVLIQQTKHGELLEALLKRGLRVDFIQGEDDQEGRQAALKKLAAGQLDVLIGTTILDVGVDVPAVGHICLAGGGKAEVALRQRIGRGLRAKKVGPNVAFVTDFEDSQNLHLRGHAQQRLAIIKGTPGFDENVLEGGKNFDFEALGFKRSAIAA